MLWPSVLGFLYQRFSLLVCNEACQFRNQQTRTAVKWRDSLSPLRAAARAQANHWNNCSQTLSLGLEDIAPRNPVRGTRPRGQQSVQAKAYPKNDPSTPQAWLPNRTEPFSISHSSMTAIFDLARFSTLRLPDGMRRPVSAGCDTLPMFDVLEAQ